MGEDAHVALEREALRVYRRYAHEVVEALGICPWAARARREGRVRERVLISPVADEEATIQAVDALGVDPSVDIGLVILPRVDLGRLDFERFVGRVREGYADRVAQGGVAMALAAFHPAAEADTTAAERLVPFLRRTPDPTIQLVRRSVLASVRRDDGHGTGFIDLRKIDLSTILEGKVTPPLHERVAEANLETVQSLGVARIRALLDDIRRDRDASYARVLSTTEPAGRADQRWASS